MKRTLAEIVLVLALAGAAAFGWLNMQSGKAASSQLIEAQVDAEVANEQLAATEKEVEEAEDALDALREEMDALKGKALELDAVKAALGNGPVLGDLEAAYKRDKVALGVDRQLGLGALRMLVKGSQDPAAVEAYTQALETASKAMQAVNLDSHKKAVCAAQIGLAAAGQKVEISAECGGQAAVAQAAPGHAAPAAPAGHGAPASGNAPAAAHAAPHWEYAGAMGPERWGTQFPTCGKGKEQSPLNIKGPFVKQRVSLAPDYKPGQLKILNNGHTIQVNVPSGSKLRLDGKPFELLQFHFHRPSEEQLDGKPMAMVVHFVHKSAEGKLAVLGVLLKEGNENPGIKALWAHAPAVETPEVEPADVMFNPANLLPREYDFFGYEGSLTTPPCTEGVSFFILKSTVNISKEQVMSFPFKMNARPVQPLNGRTIITG